jgi:hypothetical protein
MSRNARNSRPIAETTPVEEVDQVNPGTGNGEGSSNTLNGASQRLQGENNINNSGNDEDAIIDAQILAAQAAERSLRANVETLQRQQETVDAINRRILQLEQEKQALRENLRFTTSRGASVRQLTPLSNVIPSREDPGMDMDPLPPSAMNIAGYESPPDAIRPEPPFHILKNHLDREKLLKVRAPDVYRGKSLKEWRTFISSWEAVFRTQPWTYNRHSDRVNSAASSLRDEPHEAWEAAMKQTPPACEMVWERFKDYLADMLQAPQNRRQDAFEDLRSLRQEERETVAELYTRMISLEADVDPRPEKDRIRTLDAALSDYKTRNMLTAILSGGEAATVQEWFEKAQKAEHTAHPKSRRAKTGESSKGNSAPADSNINSGTQDRRKRKEKYRKDRGNHTGGNPGPSRRPSKPGTNPNPNSNSNLTCWTCQQKGHFSGSTLCPKYNEWAKENPDKAKTFEESRRLQKQVNAIQSEERSRSIPSKETGNGKAKS